MCVCVCERDREDVLTNLDVGKPALSSCSHKVCTVALTPQHTPLRTYTNLALPFTQRVSWCVRLTTRSRRWPKTCWVRSDQRCHQRVREMEEEG